jgi:hypothetical protein
MTDEETGFLDLTKIHLTWRLMDDRYETSVSP